jgi:DNA-binding CsgD family transcriptional regulator
VAATAESARRARVLNQAGLAAARAVGDRWLIAAILLQLGSLAVDTGELESAVPLLEEGLDVSRELGVPTRVGQFQWQLGRIALLRGELDRALPLLETRQYLVDTATRMGLADADPRVLVVLALADPDQAGAWVRERVARIRLHEVDDPVVAMDVGIAAEKTGDFVSGQRLLARAAEGLREQVRLGLLAQTLVHLAWAALHTGDWGVAAAAAAEGSRLARDTRQPQHELTGELVDALVAAVRGTEPDVDALVAEPERRLKSMKGGPLLATAHLARGAAALGDGRHDEAFRYLWPIFDERHASFHRFMRWTGLLDLVESAVGSGQVEKLPEVVAELEGIGARSGPPFQQAMLVCARSLLVGDAAAESSFADALGHDLTAHPFPRARTLFAVGRRLRRQRRPAEARGPLRASIDVFDTLGAAQWSKRARQELRATGEAIGRRTPDARERLTAQELQIAQLAADGLSNREIGERLFLSHRTVGGHLYRVFPKLEITGRAQLRDALK